MQRRAATNLGKAALTTPLKTCKISKWTYRLLRRKLQILFKELRYHNLKIANISTNGSDPIASMLAGICYNRLSKYTASIHYHAFSTTWNMRQLLHLLGLSLDVGLHTT